MKIGVLAFRPKPQTLAQWQPLAVALKQALPGSEFVVEAFTYPELDEAVAQRKVDFVLTNPGHYVMLEKSGGVSSPLATLAVHEAGRRTSVFGGVIFTRAGQTAIATLKDLRGKTIASPSTESLGGYQMQAFELSQIGIQLPQDAKLITTGMPHDTVVEVVLSGRAEVGFVRSGLLEGMARDGKLDLQQIKIINSQKLPNFPVQVSTRLYPEWAFTSLPHVDENLARHVAAALLVLGEDSSATSAMGIHGFSVPANYSSVEALLRALRLPPFGAAPPFTLDDIWTRYRWQILGAVLVAGLLTLLVVRLQLTNRKLAAEQRCVLLQQQQLQESEERHRLLADNAADVIWTMNLEGRFTYVSPSVEKLRGYPPEVVMRQTLEEALAPGSVEIAQSGLARSFEAVQKGLPIPFFQGELEQPRKDGSTVWTEVTTTGMTNKEGAFIGILGVTRDITERKQAEAERAKLEAHNRQLQKAESLGLMAGSIAHHFNNKLQAVMANLEVLSALPKGVDPTKYLAMAKLASTKAAEVSRQMLIYLGNIPGDRDPLVFAEFCRASQPLLQQALPSRVILESDCPASGPVIKANAEQLQQVLTNLVTNAGEAMGAAGGSLRLSLSTCPVAELPTAHRFPLGWQPLGQEYACLSLADTGCGIADADIEKLFDPFFSTKFTGRGLGLSVVLGIVQAHGGALTVESKLGQGSVFCVYFPVSNETLPRPPEIAVQVSMPEGGGTILLVDDDELLLMSTGALIEMLGFKVLTAKDGLDALELFRQNQGAIRCVLTDLTMPRMDGWETISALRQLDPALPVILASGYDRAQVLSGAHPDRPQAFLSKPFDLQLLRDALDEALQAGSTATA